MKKWWWIPVRYVNIYQGLTEETHDTYPMNPNDIMIWDMQSSNGSHQFYVLFKSDWFILFWRAALSVSIDYGKEHAVSFCRIGFGEKTQNTLEHHRDVETKTWCVPEIIPNVIFFSQPGSDTEVSWYHIGSPWTWDLLAMARLGDWLSQLESKNLNFQGATKTWVCQKVVYKGIPKFPKLKSICFLNLEN